MRTKQEIFNLVKQSGILEQSFYDAQLGQGKDYKLTDLGLVIGYGDAFSYKRSGIVVVVESGVGKSTLVQKFHKTELSDILAKNHYLISDPENNGQPEIYNDIIMETDDWMILPSEDAIDAYTNYLANNKGTPLRIVIHLTNSHEQGFVQEDIPKMFDYLYIEAEMPPIPKKGDIPEIFRQVKFLEYSKNYEGSGYRDDDHLEQVFHDVRSKLDEVLEAPKPI